MGALDWTDAQYVSVGEADPDQFNAEVVDNLNIAPRGVVDYKITASSGQSVANGSYTDITGASITFTAVAGRLYKITGHGLFTGASSAGVFLAIRKGASTDVTYSTLQRGTDTFGFIAGTVTWLEAPGAGSVTFKLSAKANAGGVAVGVGTTFIIEDVGPG